MKLLLDECIPRKFKDHLQGHWDHTQLYRCARLFGHRSSRTCQISRPGASGLCGIRSHLVVPAYSRWLGSHTFSQPGSFSSVGSESVPRGTI
jgi:hypothetical protein